MLFRGVTVEPGDLIAFRSNKLNLGEIQGAVVGPVGGRLEVITLIKGIDGFFAEEDVQALRVVLPAAQAIPQESRGLFSQGQQVSFHAGSERLTGKVVAAFLGVITAFDSENQRWLTALAEKLVAD